MKEKPIEAEVLPKETAVVRRPVGRPSKLLALVGNKSVPERITAIRDYHAYAEQSAANAVVYVILCGLELLAVRPRVEHGEWENWISRNFPNGDRTTAWRYMKAAEAKAGDPAFVARVQQMDLSTPVALLPSDQRDQLIAAVKSVAPEETLKQLYLNIGAVKAPGQRGGANNPYGRSGNPATITDRAELEAQEANTFWMAAVSRLLEASQKKTYGHLSRENLSTVTHALRSVTDELEGYLNKR